MSALRRLCVLGPLLGALVAGCVDGRGSSGFDIVENALIQRVLDTQQCVNRDKLTFCPADQEVTATPMSPTPTPTANGATPTPVPNTPRVDTQLANGASIACTRPQPDQPCTFTFAFAAQGFSPESQFGIASRLGGTAGAWVLAPDLRSAASQGGAPLIEIELAIALPPDTSEALIQFAVLAFLDQPDAQPGPLQSLSDSGADFAFVTPEFRLEVITSGSVPTQTPTPKTASPSATAPTPTAPTPTATETSGPAPGPEITYFGLARADSIALAPSAFDLAGRPIYVRPSGSAFLIVVEGRPGMSGLPVGQSAYRVGGLPDMQLVVSRPLGDGSVKVCDSRLPMIGGVPATVPLAFSAGAADAINDLGCRVDNGQGEPMARSAIFACTLDRSGEYQFVDAASMTQFCLPIARAWAFPAGDTIVAGRLRDTGGNLGPVRELIVRNADGEPTPTASATNAPATPTAPPSQSTTPTVAGTAASGTPTPQVSATPTPTGTPSEPNAGPIITHLGIARADSRPRLPIGTDGSGREIFTHPSGFGLILIVEARPGTSRQPVGLSAYATDGLPDLQVILSRPLGNGSAAVCDARPPMLGGVPAVASLRFSDEPRVVDAINDLGCRTDDGAGEPAGRPASAYPCTTTSGGTFEVINFQSTVQYCVPIAHAWTFPPGDTIVAARARDRGGNIGAAREMVVRVGQP